MISKLASKNIFLAILLTLIIIVLLSGCSDSGTVGKNDSTPSVSSSGTVEKNDLAPSVSSSDSGTVEKNDSAPSVNSSDSDTVGKNDSTPSISIQNSNGNANIVHSTDSLVYKNMKFGFSLTFPSSWKGKYMIEEGEFGITVYHISDRNLQISKKAEFFSVSRYGTIKEWDETFNDPSNLDGAPFEKIGIVGDSVYTWELAENIPYDKRIDNEKKAAEEFDNLSISIKDIIKSFKAI